MMQPIRHCPHCDARLARDQPGPLCSPCTRRAVCDDQPKAQRPEFWQSDDFRAAFAAQHFGWIILAYRKAHHPVLTQVRVGRWLGMSQAQISRLEKPDAEPPCDLRKLQHWARALKIPPELLWFAPAPATDDGEEDEPETTHGAVTLESVQRRDVIKLTGAAALTGAGILDATPWHDLIALIQPPSAPSVIGMTQIAEVRAATRTFEGWDLQHGGGMLRTAVNAQLRYCADLLNARCTDQVHTELFSAVGYFGLVAGFMAYDSFAHDDARRMFRFALSCAEEAGDWRLRAHALHLLAMQANRCGDPETGLTLSEAALLRADRLTATERAELQAGRAKTLAKLGRVQNTLTAVGLADEELSHSQPAEGPPRRTYDATRHAGATGGALWEIAVRGHFVTEARNRLSAVVVENGTEFTRARALAQAKLSSLAMATGDPAEAATLGGQALDWTGSLKSRRAADSLLELNQLSQPHAHLTEVAELRSRITAVVNHL